MIDDVDNISSLSNVASATTDDSVAPADITNLSASIGQVSIGLSSATAISSSGDKDTSHSKEAVVDGNLSTFWISTPRATMQTEQITLDLGGSTNVTRIRLRSRADSAGAFPKDFRLQLSNDNVNFTTVHTVTNFSAAAATWYSFDFTPASGRYVRVLVTKTVKWGTSFTTHIAEIEVYEMVPGGAQLSWTAPGDNLDQGTAASYDVRFATSPINNDTDFGFANEIDGEPAPQPAGSTESFFAGALDAFPGETTVYFAVKTFDEQGNFSLSNTASVVTAGVPPAAVSDLSASPLSSTSIQLSWTAVGDDGNTPATAASSYDIRLSTAPISNDADFTAATPIAPSACPTHPRPKARANPSP